MAALALASPRAHFWPHSRVAGVRRPPEQVAAGQEARVWVPFPVWRVPVLLHHDGVQRVHLRELAHVWGPLILRAAHWGLVLLSVQYKTRPPGAGRLVRLSRCSQASTPASVSQARPHPSLEPHPPWSPSCLIHVKTPIIYVNFQSPFWNSDWDSRKTGCYWPKLGKT